MTTIAVANSKGGVAKTSLTLGVGYELAQRGHRVLMIDLDHQANLTDDVGQTDAEPNMADLFANPRRCDANALVYPAAPNGQTIDNLWIMPSAIHLAVETRNAERHRHREYIIDKALQQLEQSFDVILLDCRPAIDLTLENALLLADLVMVPIDQSPRATKGIQDLLAVCDELKNGAPVSYLAVRTKVDRREPKARADTIARIADQGLICADAEMRIDANYKTAERDHMPVQMVNGKSKAASDLASLVDELYIREYIQPATASSQQEAVA